MGLIDLVKKGTAKHGAEVLTGIGITGMVSSLVLAVKATPRALELIEAKKDLITLETGEVDPQLTKLEVVKTVWKEYIPTLIVTGATIGCIIASNRVSSNHIKKITTAYTAASMAADLYKDKVLEVIGQNKKTKIDDAVAKANMDKNPVSSSKVILTGKGDYLCFDVQGSRWFRSDVEHIKKTVNEINRRLISEMKISLNDFYYELGLESMELGNTVGWNVENGLLDITFSTQLTEDDEPCLTLSYNVVSI